jgi:hypothetical protein
MAILTKGIFGPISGKLGNLVFCICVNGTNYVRTRSNKTKKLPSRAQMTQRAKFGMAAKFLTPLKEIIKKGFQKAYLYKSTNTMSLAMREMLNTGMIVDDNGPRIDFPNVKLSSGSLQPLLGVEMKQVRSNVIMVEWSCQVNRFNSFADDTVQVIVYNATNEEFVIGKEAYREDEVVMVKTVSANADDHLVLYAFLVSSEGPSGGQYLGEFLFFAEKKETKKRVAG